MLFHSGHKPFPNNELGIAQQQTTLYLADVTNARTKSISIRWNFTSYSLVPATTAVEPLTREESTNVDQAPRSRAFESGFSSPSPALDSTPMAIAQTEPPNKGDAECQTVLQVLQRALQSATDHQRDPWDFSIEISELTNLGIGKHQLRVMVCQGVISHKRETTVTGQNYRSFDPEQDVVLSERSCFVISETGMHQLESTVSRKEPLMRKPHFKTKDLAVNDSPNGAPVWDQKRRELRLGDVIVKRFKWPAGNQEQVLQAFQEEGWPAKIDDPLPPHPNICPKRRLHDTIKCLNRRQINGSLKFRGDGTGQGVLVEIRAPQSRKSALQRQSR